MVKLRTHIDYTARKDGCVTSDLWLNDMGEFVVTINFELCDVHVSSITIDGDENCLRAWEEIVK